MAKTILITGASSGIGAFVAKLFLDRGWNVGLVARRKDKLDEIAKNYDNSLCLKCDVSKEKQIENAFELMIDRFGEVNVLFNNAGIFTPQARIDQIDIKDWQKSIDVNLTGMFLSAREAFRHMKKNGGRIINNGSISAHTPREGSVPYTTTKHAITGLTKTIALDGRELNICCGQIDIGNANTEMVSNLSHSDHVVETMEVSDAAEAVWNMAQLPLSTNVLTMTIMANKMPFIGRG
ncbi:SDR family oxidoreductase [Amylibacter sp.]|jgi:NAD(P)-dependent dehydrogenase (short-subunit alcohol dehydrogenase family)|nr:SDR family oxidoreductase [Amylibacter sp.]MDB4235538.1 SDR family oxidoreductase [bacterium]MDA8853578.1 SDR family oxidoreductase [Amylibacter sp.]MDA8913502.1 SDR family oxidoreductase [Amylibacter sp.]MDA9074883.1 SDR family oxidoreductase [Amylibacter sp.]|tara:strand:+ start:8617 stop:9324 length:708 start_codon:yes stop_codon:yes gene_type:complete